jgi:hypothetical protein
MEIEEWAIIRLELKYCERCGGLWLRQRGTGRVYCAACTTEISDFPLYRRRIARTRLPTNRKLGIGSQAEPVRAVDGGCI